jgi:hypothetical protein
MFAGEAAQGHDAAIALLAARPTSRLWGILTQVAAFVMLCSQCQKGTA